MTLAAYGHRRPPSVANAALFVVFLLGIYLNVSIRLPGGVPVPAVVSGCAGALLLAVNASSIRVSHFSALAAVLTLLMLTVLIAPDMRFLQERFKGFVQLAYSLIIAFGAYLAAIRLERRTLEKIFLTFCVAIVVGAWLETHTGLRTISDSFRNAVFQSSVYDAELRDEALYGAIRPRLFTSEPSILALSYSLFLFCWYVLSRAGAKLIVYIGFTALGYHVIHGPTILAGIALVPVYQVFLGARRGPPGASRTDGASAAVAIGSAAILAVGLTFAASTVLSERLSEIAAGRDASFFGRIVAPPQVAADTVLRHPLVGAGLSGWEFIEDTVRHVYAASPELVGGYVFDGAQHAVTNSFWLHWIFLGLGGGVAVFVALTAFLRSLGTPSMAFCWCVWAVLCQGVGGYVSPQTWAVLFIPAAIALVHERGRASKPRTVAVLRREPRLNSAYAEGGPA